MPNKYARIAQAELDLHHFTRAEAAIAIKDFLQDSQAANYNLVRIIVGKGLHSSEGPVECGVSRPASAGFHRAGSVLGDFVRDWLKENDYDFKDAKLNEGGGGAIDVKL